MPVYFNLQPFELSFSLEISYMPNTLVLTSVYFIMLVIVTSYQTINSDLYTVLLEHTLNPFFHLLHIAFFLFVFYGIVRFTINFFLETLTGNEQALINDNLFLFLTDTMLIISIFSDEVSLSNLSLFVILVLIKCLAWLVAERVNRQKDLKIRIFISIVLIPTILCLVSNLYGSLTAKSLHFLFSFEYAIIALLLIKSLILTLISDPYHILCTDISYTGLKLISLVLFFIITTINYRIPFNVFRESVATCRVLLKKITNYFAYKKILDVIIQCERVDEGMCPICAEEFGETSSDEEEIQNDNEKKNNQNSDNGNSYNQTSDNNQNKNDLSSSDTMEETKNRFTPDDKKPKPSIPDTNPGIKLACTHTFHLACLKRWVESQQVCPVCRDKIIKKKDETQNSTETTSETFEGIPIADESEI